MPYNEHGKGTLWIPEDEDKQENLLKSLKESFKDENLEDQWLGGYNPGDFKLEEMYVKDYKDLSLEIVGDIDNVLVSLSIPIKNNEDMQRIVEKLSQKVTIDTESSGLYLKPNDFSEVRTKTADGQGRINLGSDRAGKDIRVVVLNE